MTAEPSSIHYLRMNLVWELENWLRASATASAAMIGYCNDEPHMIIVYDFMANRTLRDHLYSTYNPSVVMEAKAGDLYRCRSRTDTIRIILRCQSP
jgi:hypothetical protein